MLVRARPLPMAISTHLNEEQPPPPRLPLDSPHVKQAVCKDSRQDVRKAHGSPEESQSQRELGVLVKVRQVQDDLRSRQRSHVDSEEPGTPNISDETALQQTEQGTEDKEGSLRGEPELGAGHDAPEHHLRGDPAVRTDPFRHELRRELGAQEAELEEGVAEVVVCS